MNDNEKRVLKRLIDAASEVLRFDELQLKALKKMGWPYLNETVADAKQLLGEETRKPETASEEVQHELL